MFSALALIVTVQSGQTMSGIASSHGLSLASVEADNPQVGNPDLIYAGQTLKLSGGGGYAQWTPSTPSPAPSSPVSSSPASGQSSPSSSSGGSGTTSSASGFHIPGMSDSMAACIAYRESTNLQNPAANGNAFGIIPASGHNVAGMSLGQQEQVAGQIYATSGGAAWAADGCPGT